MTRRKPTSYFLFALWGAALSLMVFPAVLFAGEGSGVVSPSMLVLADDSGSMKGTALDGLKPMKPGRPEEVDAEVKRAAKKEAEHVAKPERAAKGKAGKPAGEHASHASKGGEEKMPSTRGGSHKQVKAGRKGEGADGSRVERKNSMTAGSRFKDEPTMSQASAEVDASAKRDGGLDFYRPYVGLGYQLSYRSGGSIAYANPERGVDTRFSGFRYFNGLAPYVGMKFGRYLAAEVGFSMTQRTKSKESVTAANEVVQLKGRFYGPSVDFFGYYPVQEGGSLDLIGTTGFTLHNAKVELTRVGGTQPFQETKSALSVGMRMGGGFAYHVSRHVDWRLVLQYNLASYNLGGHFPGNLSNDGIYTLTLSLSYLF